MQSYQISINPFTKKENIQVPTQTPHEIESVITSSALAYKTWSKLAINSRITKLLSFKEQIEMNQVHLAKIISTEMGCPVSQTILEVQKVCTIIDYFCNKSEEILKPTIIEETESSSKQIHYAPYGTLFHIAPYNYPLYLALRPIIPSLLAGNTNILKTPSNTPILAEEIQKLIKLAGFEEGVFEVVFVGGGDTKQIIEDPRINLITLIGSERAGAIVAETAGSLIKKTILELGGNDAMIICEDADITKAVSSLIASRLRNAGQSCNAVKRVIIHASAKAQFTNELIDQIQKLTPGDPLDESTTLGPLATEKSLDLALEQIENSVKLGAKILSGGKRNDDFGYYLEPTIIDEVSPEMPVFFEEVFAPVIPLTSFSTIDEAIELANNSRYGLGGCIWTKNQEYIQKAVNNIETGNLAINGIVRGDPSLPYGGVKKSGYGREFGEIGLKELTNIKSITIQK